MLATSIFDRRTFLARSQYAVVVVFSGGCSSPTGPPRGAVVGRVTNGGQRVTDATISFENATAGIALWAELDGEGCYTIQTYQAAGLPVGTYRVAIKPLRKSATIGNVPPLLAPPGEQDKEHPLLPKRFHTFEQSGLKITVQAGNESAFDFDLSK